jgi:hypothetical protein
MDFKEKYKSIEKKMSTFLIYLFLIVSFIFPIISIFITELKEYKLDLQIVIIVSSITIVFNLLKNMNINIRNTEVNKLTPYTSTTTNMSEVESKLESFKTCDLYVLGNSLGTMWNSLLKHFFTRIKNGEIRMQLNVIMIKRVKSQYKDSPLTEPIISAIVNWFTTNNTNINMKIYVIEYPIYFTGICMNDEYLKYRFLNGKTNKEILGSAYKGTSDIADRTIDWFRTLFEDICNNNQPIYEYTRASK